MSVLMTICEIIFILLNDWLYYIFPIEDNKSEFEQFDKLSRYY